MKVKQLIQNPEGTYEFTADLDEDQYNYIFETGLAVLLQLGAFSNEASKEADEDYDEETLN